MKLVVPFVIILMFVSFSAFVEPVGIQSDTYWLLYNDDSLQTYGYKNSKGEIMIAPGKYSLCYTDTFRYYACVIKPGIGLVAIDKKENVLYKVYVFDNGPDYPSEGLFRIWKNGKMGYADERTGKIILYPQFTCGFPFENGCAKVSLTACESVPVDKFGEFHRWETEEWFYIDHTGKKVDPPANK
jgi:hypothetical protein